LDNCSSALNGDPQELIGFHEWDSLTAMSRLDGLSSRIRAHLAKEDGNVESALVLIPLLMVFLIGAQVIAATNLRNADLAMAQGDAAARAISQEFHPDDELIEIGGGVEKIRVLVTHRSHTVPQLVPGLIELLGGAPATDVVGIAVIEPSGQ
jgi:hypothetical protein